MFSSLDYVVILRDMVQKDPGSIVGPISKIFGVILNVIFNFVSSITSSDANLLGISIILFTIVARFIMLPLAIKSQKSMSAMQKMQPELEKLKEKYGDSKDPEIQRKMSIEMNKLYKEHNANPLGGCLPLLIQFPFFMGMYYIMNQSYRFIDRLGAIYHDLASKIMEIPNYVDYFYNFGYPKVPANMVLDMKVTDDMIKILGKFKPEDWQGFLSAIPQEYAAGIQASLGVKESMEQFFGIALTENAGLGWPMILIPILAVITSFLTSYISSKQTTSTDPNMQMQQKMMMIVMPLMMGFITIGMPGGVGLYWITSSIFQVIQQIVLHKIFRKKDGDDSGDTGKIIKKEPVKAKN